MRTAVPLVLLGGLLTTASAADPIPSPIRPKALPLAVSPPLASPPLGQLRSDTAALAKDREDAVRDAVPTATSNERAALRGQLAELIKRLNERKQPPEPNPRLPIPQRPKGFELPEQALDTIRMAEDLFRADEVDAALRAFRLVDQTSLTREDRAFVQYMTACCLRKMNKRSDAAEIYRDVADAKEDKFIAECAVWQLSLINSTKDLEAQLEQLRSRPKSR